MRKKLLAVLLCTGMLLAACGNSESGTGNESETAPTATKDNLENTETSADSSSIVDYDNHLDDTSNEIFNGEFKYSGDNPSGIENDGSKYTIQAAGEYTFSGTLSEGQIVVEAGAEDEVVINLSNTQISCSNDAPIKILSAGQVKIKAVEGTYNRVTDARAAKISEDSENDSETDSENGICGSAIYATCDLSVAGKGTLIVDGGYNNGIHTKNDLKIKNVTLRVESYGKCLKGNDSVEIESGNFSLVSDSGDGIKTTNNDISDKGNQKGNITIYDGTIEIQASQDAIDAVNDVNVEGGKITIACKKDGIHGDNIVNITGGEIQVNESGEGIEGNQVVVNGGKTYVYATDDGVNASSGSATPLVQINGGYLEVKTASGDTDGIDSNGSYEQTGGFVLVRSGSMMGNMAGSVDVNGNVTVTGGSIVALGGICELPSNSCNVYGSSTLNLEKGNYSLKNSKDEELFGFAIEETYNSFWICSDVLTTGEDYVLKNGTTEIAAWNQEEGITGEVTSGFGGRGGFGGTQGGGKPGRPEEFGGNQEGEKPGKPEEFGGNQGGERPTGMEKPY